MIAEETKPIVVAPVCRHSNATPATTYRETPSGNIEMTKEIVCPDCGAKAWFLTSHGATQQIVVPITWDSTIAMEATARARASPTPNGKRRPTHEEVIAGLRRKHGEGPGAELAVLIWQRGLVMSCQACDELSKQMNEWGLETCRERIDEIVEDMLPRARQWVQENRPAAIRTFVEETKLPQRVKDWLNGKRGVIDAAARAAGALVDVETPVLRGKVRELVTEALANWESRQPTLLNVNGD